ncbi:MAG: formyltransferase family protein [Pirellulales bacterium]
MKLNTVIAGVGALAEALTCVLDQSAGHRVGLVIDTGPGSKSLQNTTSAIGADYLQTTKLNHPNLLEQIDRLQPDYIFSADNQYLFRNALLNIAAHGCINFHNGPLSQYRGVNIPSWAIWNNESMHSISWHFMLEKIDAGDVIMETPFAIDKRETAFSLSVKCIQAGIDSTPALIEKLSNPDTVSIHNHNSSGRYYSRHDLPNDGILDARWSAKKLDRLYRALSYKSIPNHVGKLRLLDEGKLLVIKSLKWLPDKSLPVVERNNQCVLKKTDGNIVVTFPV